MVRAITARCRRSDLGGCADAPTIIWSLRVQQGWLAGRIPRRMANRCDEYATTERF
jgi:hypothetical protein